MDRRTLLKGAVATAILPVSRIVGAADAGVLTRAIPATGEQVPILGMGTFQVFGVGEDIALRDHRASLVEAFFGMGGLMLDASPMYVEAESVIGHALRKLGRPDGMISSTRFWNVEPEGARGQLEQSLEYWGEDSFDIFMLHNVVANWEPYLELLADLKASGKIRYTGITTSHGREHGRLERIMATQPIDFVQLTYSIADRGADNRLLPLAREKGIAVQVNRPFQGGALFPLLAGKPLPGWASDIGCAAWSQVLLKYAASHPAATCVLFGTSRLDHMRENMGAISGELPDAALRARMERDFASLV